MSDTKNTVPYFEDDSAVLPAIAQDIETNEVLMLAYMNQEAFAETVKTGRAVYFSRSRQRLWRKGEQSGHVQRVERILVDCDGDTILLKVRQTGVACHEGYRSCFFREVRDGTVSVIADRLVNPADVYK